MPPQQAKIASIGQVVLHTICNCCNKHYVRRQHQKSTQNEIKTVLMKTRAEGEPSLNCTPNLKLLGTCASCTKNELHKNELHI